MSYRRRYYRRRYGSSKSFIELFLYVLILPFILLGLCIKLVVLLIKKCKYKKYSHFETKINIPSSVQSEDNIEVSSETELNTNDEVKYQQKESLLTNYEKYFYDIFERNFGDKYKIQTQVNLASVITKTNKFKYQNELYRNIDFGFFDKETLKPLLLIEINDATHQNKNRYERDLKVRNILEQAGIKLITFYSFYDNNEDYIVHRILQLL